MKYGTLEKNWPGIKDPRTFDPSSYADAALRAAGQYWPQSEGATSAGSARGRSLHSDYARAPAMAPSPSPKALSVPDARPDGEEPWRPTMRGTAAAAAAAAPATKRARSEQWADTRDAASGSADWIAGATPVLQLSNQAQMKMVKVCTKCGAEGHCAQDCTGAAASAPASSSVVPQGATTAEPAGSMPPPSACPKGKVVAQGRAAGSYARYHAGRSAKAKGAEKGKSSRPPAPEVPASAYGSGTYDAARAERVEVEAKGKTKKGQSKKGKDTRSERAQDSQGWWNRSWWEHGRG